MIYRPEIDGLRALAVIPVILFHAGFDVFSGGFVGVDVFFVISGYLITSILINDIERNRFSIINFYERRARRILPALFFVIICSIPFALIFMLPIQMKDFSTSLIAVSIFSSNILFWQKSGYFETNSEEIPLLHTWSLAIEEQYYIFFPILLLISWRFGKKSVFFILLSIAFISFFLSEWGWRNKPDANFYLIPSRAWELLCGSISAFVLNKRSLKGSNLLSILGVVLIIISIFTYNETTPFPSFYTLIPVFGSMLIVIFASKDTFVSRFLRIKLFVGIGLISYSAYLWHQPILAFAKIYSLKNPSQLTITFLIFISFFMSYLSWRYVEKPFRSNKIKLFTRNKIFLISLSLIFLISIFGLIGNITNGFQQQMLKYKFSKEESEKAKLVLKSIDYDIYEKMAVKDCKLWSTSTNNLTKYDLNLCAKKYGKAIVILGDSHAMNLFNIISYSNAYPFIIGVSQGGCRPHDEIKKCHYKGFNDFIDYNKEIIDFVIFHQSGSYFIKDKYGKLDSQNAFMENIFYYEKNNIYKVSQYLHNLAIKNNLKLLWIGPFLEYRWEPEKMFFSDKLEKVNPVSIKIFKKLESVISNSIREVDSFIYKPFNSFFYEPTVSFRGDCFMFRDTDHFSLCGEKIIGKKLNPRFLDQVFMKK